MENLQFVVFVILISANILICRAFFTDQSIDVATAVKFYNSIPGLSWKAGRNGYENNIKLSHMKSRLGWIPKEKKTRQNKASASFSGLYGETDEPGHIDDLPKQYDCRDAYPECTTIRSIKNQGNCGSCWAIATASVFSDRLCIHSRGEINFNMSAEQLIACDEKSKGCEGGYIDTPLEYIANHGLVTGGDYGSNEGCWPYSIPPKRSFFPSSSKTPECKEVSCPQLYTVKNDSIDYVEPDEYYIRKEILENGPITAGFMVYLSFKFYSEGIYSRLFIDWPLGPHAVRVIGWGEENEEKYWLVANSWGEKWGENGTFRIRRDTDECGIETHTMVAQPVV